MAKSAFMEMLRSEMRLRGYAHRTEKTYLYWIRHFIRYHQLKHPQNMSGQEVKPFLTVRDGKGNKGRQTLLSRNLKKHLSDLINSALDVQANDNKNGIGPSLPPALSKKYPNAYRSPGWMYLFPSPVPPAH